MDQSFDLIASCVDKIFTEDEVWTTADCTKKEMNDFLEQMNSSQFKEIESFLKQCLSYRIRSRSRIQRLRLKAKLCLRDWHLFSPRDGSYES